MARLTKNPRILAVLRDPETKLLVIIRPNTLCSRNLIEFYLKNDFKLVLLNPSIKLT